MRPILRLAAAAATVALLVPAPPVKADVIDMVCQGWCFAGSVTCLANVDNAEFCAGYFAGCMTGCGF